MKPVKTVLFSILFVGMAPTVTHACEDGADTAIMAANRAAKKWLLVGRQSKPELQCRGLSLEERQFPTNPRVREIHKVLSKCQEVTAQGKQGVSERFYCVSLKEVEDGICLPVSPEADGVRPVLPHQRCF